MKFSKKVTIFLIALIIVSCTVNFANAERQFSRYKGRALKLGIPLYQGIPPEQYKYKSLGDVEGEHTSTFFDSTAVTISRALENLAEKAKELGANAVIKIEPQTKGATFIYKGEAIIFEELPENANVKE